MRLHQYLWLRTGDDPPLEWLTYRLCTLYRCRPSELWQEKVEDIMPHLTCMDVEARVRQKEAGG